MATNIARCSLCQMLGNHAVSCPMAGNNFYAPSQFISGTEMVSYSSLGKTVGLWLEINGERQLFVDKEELVATIREKLCEVHYSAEVLDMKDRSGSNQAKNKLVCVHCGRDYPCPTVSVVDEM